jgi:hypothetical protein
MNSAANEICMGCVSYGLIAKFLERVSKLGNLLMRDDDARVSVGGGGGAEDRVLENATKNYNITDELAFNFN